MAWLRIRIWGTAAPHTFLAVFGGGDMGRPPASWSGLTIKNPGKKEDPIWFYKLWTLEVNVLWPRTTRWWQPRNWLIVEDLAQFKDPMAIKEIELAFTKGLVDEYYIDLVKVKRIYRTPDDDMRYQRDDWEPIEHFSQENIEYLDKLHYVEAEKQKKSGSKLTKGKKKKKIGRNDPCPCGSGKKYKKCCLRKESL